MALDATSCCSYSGAAEPLRFLKSPFSSLDFVKSEPSDSGDFLSASVAPSTRDPFPIFDRGSGAATSSSTSASSSSFELSPDHLDCRGSSPDPMINFPEDDLPRTVQHDLHEMDHVSQYLDFETKPPLDDSHPSHASFCSDSGCNDDMFFSRLGKVLGSDSSQDVLNKSGPTTMNDLFPDWSIPQDFSTMDEIAPWPSEDNQIECLTSLLMEKAEDVQKVPSGTPDEQECASQIFAHWLQSNSHWVHMSDLRKIKLKMSTVENATRRLGGGKKGLMLFLKFVLIWIQNSKQNASTDAGAACMSPRGLPSDITPSPGFMAAMSVSGEGVSNSDTFLPTVTSNSLVDVKAQLNSTFPSCGSSPNNASSANWNASRGQAAHTTSMLSNFSNSELRCYSPITDSSHCSLLQGSSFNQPNNSLLHHDSHVMHGICPSTLSPIFHSPTPSQEAHNWGPRNINGTVTGPMQQRQSACSNLAATFRAARKNRMERQRWSVRHNRKWAAANQQRHTPVPETPAGYEHLNTSPSWSQSLGNGRQNFSCVSPQACQPMSRVTNPVDHQQRNCQGKDLKLLFHKQLKQSDVGSSGRIVLPKAAETCLPPLDMRDGASLVVEDMNTSKVWNMRYRFWPNNKSRMYVLENTSDFVKLNDLKEGDRMLMYQLSNRYVIRGIKATGIQSSAASGSIIEFQSGLKRKGSFSMEEDEEGEEGEEETNLSAVTDEMNTEESCIDDMSFVELIEQSLEGVQ